MSDPQRQMQALERFVIGLSLALKAVFVIGLILKYMGKI